MNTRTPEELQALVEDLGPAEKLLQLILNFPDHLWHNRPGVIENNKWRAATPGEIRQFNKYGTLTGNKQFRAPGANVEAIEKVYSTLAEIWEANEELMARLASYIMRETDWKDMKVVCAAFMLVQSRSGQPVFDEANGEKTLLFHDDDYREIGEAMVKMYQRGSARMMNPKMIQRIGVVLALPAVMEANKVLGFGNAQKRKAFTGRYYPAVRDWLRQRDMNPAMLEGLRKAGFARIVRGLSRMAGYKPESKRFFEILGWRQKQHPDGHRGIGLDDLNIERFSFKDLSEREICEAITERKMGYKQVVGMLPPEIGLTPAIFVAAMDSLSDKDLTILTPTLEEMGLMKHAAIRERWQKAIQNAEDQRTRNIAKNVRNRETAQSLRDAADGAVARVVEEATKDADIHIMFLIDKSGSMQGAIEKSKEALSRILQGFEPEKLHIACFDTFGTVMQPKQYSEAGIRHMLSSIRASGGTIHGAAVKALHKSGTRVPESADLIVFVVGDEAGESGDAFANTFTSNGYTPSAFAHIVNVASGSGWNYRGNTVSEAATHLNVPYTEVGVEQFEDAYQVQRTLKAILEAQPLKTKGALLEKIMGTELLVKPY